MIFDRRKFIAMLAAGGAGLAAELDVVRRLKKIEEGREKK